MAHRTPGPRRYQHKVALQTTERNSWNYFREMLQVANVDPANRKSVREHGVEQPEHWTYFVHDEDCLEWTRWLIRNGFNFRYGFSADGFQDTVADK